jgi:chemotaxis protein MotB
MKAVTIISLIVAAALAVAAWLFYRSSVTAKEEKAQLETAREELLVRVGNLEQQKMSLTQQLEEQIASISKEKEKEIERLRATYDTLVNDLKGEIDKGQITITKLADRLSVSMVDRILFPSGEAEITSEGVKVLQRVGNVLKNTTNKTIRVEGHTDNVPISEKLIPTFATNWELSTARATNVVRFLQEKVGIEPARLEAVGLSEFHPVASNTTSDGRSQNRRIDIALLPDYRESAAGVR